MDKDEQHSKNASERDGMQMQVTKQLPESPAHRPWKWEEGASRRVLRQGDTGDLRLPCPCGAGGTGGHLQLGVARGTAACSAGHDTISPSERREHWKGGDIYIPERSGDMSAPAVPMTGCQHPALWPLCLARPGPEPPSCSPGLAGSSGA